MPAILTIEPPAEARVLVISDLHLGHERSCVSEVQGLAPLLEGIDLLIVAGDTAETRPNEWQERGLRLREEFRALCREKGVLLIELGGNHDPETDPLLLKLWGGKVVIMHGHALFRVVAPWSWEYLRNKAACKALVAQYPTADTDLEARLELSRAMSQLVPPIMRREGIRQPLLRGLMHCFWPPQRPLSIVAAWLLCGMLANHFAKVYFPEAETVIFGHFHRSGHWHFGKRLLYNTGAWFRHASPYAVLLSANSRPVYQRILMGTDGIVRS